MTNSNKAAEKRWYDDACGAAHALELVGERWSLLVMRELLYGPRRFGEIRGGLPGISANVLTQRLEGLEAEGIVVRKQLPSPANAQVYELTPWGYESEPIFQTLGRWAARSPSHDASLPLSPASLMSSFRTMFDPKRGKALEATVGIRFPSDAFVARVHDGALTVRRVVDIQADVTLTARDPGLVAAVVYGGLPLEPPNANGAITVEGDRAIAKRFIALFRLPPKVGA